MLFNKIKWFYWFCLDVIVRIFLACIQNLRSKYRFGQSRTRTIQSQSLYKTITRTVDRNCGTQTFKHLLLQFLCPTCHVSKSKLSTCQLSNHSRDCFLEGPLIPFTFLKTIKTKNIRVKNIICMYLAKVTLAYFIKFPPL